MEHQNMEKDSQVVTSNHYERRKTLWSLLLCFIGILATTVILAYNGQLL